MPDVGQKPLAPLGELSNMQDPSLLCVAVPAVFFFFWREHVSNSSTHFYMVLLLFCHKGAFNQVFRCFSKRNDPYVARDLVSL